MGRYYTTNRGKALSISSFGYPISEGLFPLAAVAIMQTYDWRSTWLMISGFILVIILPIASVLVRFHPALPLEEAKPTTSNFPLDTSSLTRREVLRESSFYLLIPAALATPFIVTGIFFHQVHIASIKSYELNAFASGFVTFAGITVAASILAGLLIDKFGARKLLPYFLIPLALGVLVLGFANDPIWIHAFMGLAGFSAGLYATISGAIWPELFGTKHLGAIRSMVMALMVFSTAASPVLFGFLFDKAVPLVTILLSTCIYVFVASLLTLRVATRG
jgi:MFS family permease